MVSNAPMVYPGAGVAVSNGSAWGTSLTVGTSANNLVQLDSSAQLPNGTSAVTQTQGDNSTKVATTAYVDVAVAASGGGTGTDVGAATIDGGSASSSDVTTIIDGGASS